MLLKSTVLCLFISVSALSQNLTAKLIDKTTNAPIPYATIKTGTHTGVISNEEGVFTLYYKNEKKEINISCMGYESISLTIAEIGKMNNIIPLAPAINELNEVFISNRAPNADSIISKVKSKLSENYNNALNQYTVFHRTTDRVNFNKLEFEIDKASHVKKQQLREVNKSLTDLATQVKYSNMVQFADFKGDIYALDKDSIRLEVEKATRLLDHKNDFSLEKIQEKAQRIVLTYLDTTKTYKLKTGLFKIEDSLSLKDEEFEDENENQYHLSHLNNRTKSLLRASQFYDTSFLNKILNPKLYEYAMGDVATSNGELIYIITFTPRKGKAKYAGKLFIADDNYAVTRMDYDYYKNRHGSKVNLRLILGVKYIENVSKGTILFEKDSSQIYHPKYIKRTTGSYFYVSRPLKLIENSDEKYKVNFDFKIEGDNLSKEELLITSHNKLSFLGFQAVRQAEKASYQVLNSYEKTIWDNEVILAPSEEMKTFDSAE